jgi:MerR family mercuric resistance operon transcriptional regulator
MRIGELARRAGVNVQTVRYYERRGLLPDPRASERGYREYGEATLERLRFIKRAQDLGFTLAEISELLALRLGRGATAGRVKARAQAKIREIEGRLRDLERIRHALSHLAGECTAGSGPLGVCPLLAAHAPIGPAR